MHWKHSPKNEKSADEQVRRKAMPIVISDIKGVGMLKWLTENQSINKNYIRKGSIKLSERVIGKDWVCGTITY